MIWQTIKSKKTKHRRKESVTNYNKVALLYRQNVQWSFVFGVFRFTSKKKTLDVLMENLPPSLENLKQKKPKHEGCQKWSKQQI